MVFTFKDSTITRNITGYLFFDFKGTGVRYSGVRASRKAGAPIPRSCHERRPISPFAANPVKIWQDSGAIVA
jgi:hypothetical protein